jgi:2-polyprenyl-6-methoxyphenol hydroxylase-like FAD-dependent oxidoreductase
MPAPKPPSVLVSGAGIAGPVLAYWLSRSGWDVMVVERASSVRGGGYPVDIRGAALEVARRMSIDSRLRDLHVDTQRITFVDGRGRISRSLDAAVFAGQQVHEDLEVPRGGLSEILCDLTRDDADYIFDESIVDMRPDAGGVDVTLRNGGQRRFGIVIGADGIHSNVRGLAFGSESDFDRYLGWCFVVFTAPNRARRAHECVVYNEPGRVAAMYAVGECPDIHVLLGFKTSKPVDDQLRDPEAMRRLVSSAFIGSGWEIDDLLADLKNAPDAFYDTISQIHMRSWSSGRIAVVGDAAYAPSFLSGQGTSTAIVGAFVFAGALSDTREHDLAFARAERLLRPYIAQNQALARGASALTIDSRLRIFARNQVLRLLPPLAHLRVTSRLGANLRRAANGMVLPDYRFAAIGDRRAGINDAAQGGSAHAED